MSNRSADSVPPEAAIRLDGVGKRFGDVVALADASLKVAKGEFITLLGPSGCGKTTLLNLVAGFLRPDAGEIFIAGQRVTDVPAYRRGIGLVFQNYALFPHMSVADNVGYGLKMRGLARAEIARRVGEALDLVKLGGLGDRRPRQLSGGQQQRVALARAFVIEPSVLLLDEPFSALDKNLRGSMQVELKELQHRLGVTTIFVTHDQSEALSLSDRIAVISGGRIRQIGTAEEIYRHPADRFVASFVGDVNALAGRVVASNPQRTLVEIGERRVPVDGGDALGRPGTAVDLFVRPEKLRLTSGDDAILIGRVLTRVYQGAHVDLHVGSDFAAGGRVIVRLPAEGAAATLAEGDSVGVTFSDEDAVAFPAAR